MKIFLGNPPWRIGKKYGVRAGSRWPHFPPIMPGRTKPDYIPFPFFLAYTAAVLEVSGFDVFLSDSIAEGDDDEQFISKVKSANPDLYLTETSTPSFNHDIQFARRTRQELGPEKVIALAGPHATVMHEDILKQFPWIDAILLGEYEYTAAEFAKCIGEKRDPGSVPGLVYKRRDGSIVRTAPRPLLENIDKLPWPARHFTDMKNYNDAFCGLPRPNLQMWASRGCPFKCAFCLWPQVMYGGNRYRVRDPADVAEEMARVSRQYGMKSVYFDDDTFDIGKSRMLKLAGEIKSRNTGLPWGMMARADTIDAETLEALKDAGLFAVKYGVETADRNIMNAIGKGLDLGKVEETIKVTRALGIKFHLTFTFGMPGETWDTVRKTVDYALSMAPDSAQFSIATPFPGTEHYSWARSRGFLLTEDFSKYDGAGQAVARTEAMSGEDLEEALRWALEKWSRHVAVRNLASNADGQRLNYLKKGFRHPLKAARYMINHIKDKLPGGKNGPETP